MLPLRILQVEFTVMDDLGFDEICEREKAIQENYCFGEEIGHGSYGTVKLCKNRFNGETFACKTIQKKSRENPMELEVLVHGEVEIMRHLRDQGYAGVVNLEEVYEDQDSYHLVMELVSGGNLCDKFKKVWPCSESTVVRWMKQIMTSIKYCHDRGVIHRDIKLDNVLITSSGCLKLADFGLAARFSEGEILCDAVGTPDYVAPEVLQECYTEKADIWSAGVLSHVLLVGYFPFKGQDFRKAIMTTNLRFDSGRWLLVSSSARDLISRMLTRDVEKRLSAAEVLRHPWLSEVKKTRVCAPSYAMQRGFQSAIANVNMCPAY